MFDEIPTKSKYGYARVSCSTSQQNKSYLEEQKEQLRKVGIPESNIQIEVGSAANNIKDRPIFYNLIEKELTENDVLFVTKMDHCSTNSLEFLKLQERLHKKGVTFISLDLPYSNDMAVNKMIATTFCTLAKFENESRKDRQKQGIEAAKAAGKYKGRKSVINTKLINEVADLKENKQLSVTKIAEITGRSRGTIYKVLKEKLT